MSSVGFWIGASGACFEASDVDGQRRAEQLGVSSDVFILTLYSRDGAIDENRSKVQGLLTNIRREQWLCLIAALNGQGNIKFILDGRHSPAV